MCFYNVPSGGNADVPSPKSGKQLNVLVFLPDDPFTRLGVGDAARRDDN